MSVRASLRQAIKRGIRTAYWLWSRRLEAAAVRQSRSDYKATWDRLATRESDAKMFVASSTDEGQFAESGAATLAVLRQKAGITKDDIVLEIGCGVGRVGDVVAPLAKRWIGTDISKNMLQHAARRLAGHGNVDLVELHAANLAEIPDASVDVVYCTVVFMHLYEWDRYRYVQEAHRVLRPNGRCYFDNVDLASGHGWKVFSDSATYPARERPAYLPMTSTGEELHEYASRAGFHEIQVHRWDDAWVAVTGVKT